MVKIWFPKEATIKIDAAADVTIAADGSTVLDTAFSSATAIEGQMKDISITSPVGDVEIIQLMGVDGNDFQNAELEEKPPGLFEISGTIVVPGDELIESELFGAGTSATTHTTYLPGKATRTKVAMLWNLDDSTDEVNWAVSEAIVTEYNPSTTGADGHVEASITLKGLPKNFFGPQFKD